MPARAFMVQGTASSVGKSLIAAALCRIFARRGLRVVPFKAQNMSNNAAALPDGGEIGRAQYLQALAARTIPSPDMNPILLKPETDAKSQVIVLGKRWETLGARDYYRSKPQLWDVVKAAYRRLADAADLVVIEGAGSPAEINLAESDMVNMAMARFAEAPVILVADIDPGGVFAQVVGTLALLKPEDRARVKGVLINKFRGDKKLLEPGLVMLEQLTGVPVLGVVPMLNDLDLPDEDSASLERKPPKLRRAYKENPPSGMNDGTFDAAGQLLDIAIIRLPHISNFDDFDPLLGEPAVQIRYVEKPEHLGCPDVVIVPGTKATMADLAWMKARGFDIGLKWLVQTGTRIIGICGGYQMLGTFIRDPLGLESMTTVMDGIGLLPVYTVFSEEKSVCPSQGILAGDLPGQLRALAGLPVAGYEIHSGRTTVLGQHLIDTADGGFDGACAHDGRIWGTYFHGIFASDRFRTAWLASFGINAREKDYRARLEASLERLADAVEAELDMKYLMHEILHMEDE